MPKPRVRGVTIIEMIVVIVITGILATAVAVFLRHPIQAYVDASRRAELSDTADTALRRITRDLRTALPNSIRITTVGSVTYLEYLEVRTGGRFRTEVPTPAVPSGANTCPDLAPLDGTADENVFQFGAADTCFGTIGDIPDRASVTTTDFLVVYNLGPGNLNADAYETGAVTGGNKSLIAAAVGAGAGGENVVTFQSNTFTLASPGKRFQIVSGPVTYACDTGAGVLRRHWNYAISIAQPTPPGGSNALLATNVTGCSFVYTTGGSGQRTGVVALTLQITQDGESVRLFQQAHVSNVP